MATVAAVLSLAAALIHAAVLPGHWAEIWQHGVFMLAATVGQAAGAVLLLAHRRRWVLVATVAGNLLIVAVAVWAYTTGLPLWMYGDGREALNWPVVAGTGAEAALVAACVALLRRPAIHTRT